MTIIIGRRSNLSQELSKKIKDCILISSNNIDNELVDLSKSIREPVNIVFNNFQNSTLLNENSRLDKYIEKSILDTSKVLEIISINNIDVSKIIYTSSSSVYGNNKFCSESDQVMPLSLQSALKISNEELMKRFCESRSIDYTIVRIFNMYGGEDKFSVISKIKNAYLDNEKLNIINDGTAIRDFIHIDDVVNVYLKLLEIKTLPKILNVATGNGKRVSDILNYLKTKSIKIQTENIQRDELKASIANTDLLNTIVDTSNFQKVEDFLLKELY
ncbi:NAD-dependent epimerase/dehydratase family protein [Aliarcobacter butzleri]|uniref:NAD-dependent epimerase/dehydratase family protein n=1 Tax=Aliarcobacter butzleri TaxID=28197 RepID=UPI0002295C48|nr:NAD-dependent epimerase/dehydratase family protein [Aliarcobacter butzleri]UWY60838.1 NAD-dependent epimerase/dehydratase family protein [Aliarcobacter butzleri]BAK70354.1 epimerase/dehydratase [Aliarcobacter butzleri ED-1]